MKLWLRANYKYKIVRISRLQIYPTNLSSLFSQQCVYNICLFSFVSISLVVRRTRKTLKIHMKSLNIFLYFSNLNFRQPNLPSKRLELTLNKFTTVALPLHLNVINQHTANIERVSSI